MVGFRHDGDDGDDVDVAYGGEVGAAEQDGANADEILALVRVFGDFEGDGFDAGYDFGRGEGMPDVCLVFRLRCYGGIGLTGR